MSVIKVDDVREAVQKRYGEIAERFEPAVAAASCCEPAADGQASSCCGEAEEGAGYFSNLYDQAELADLPEDVTGLSLGCGDPITLANLEEGQTVLDLGSGGGIDVFLAAKKVGETGFAIGVDMTPAMLEKARRNQAKLGVSNVDFREGQIEALPVDDDAVDVIVSNCVINLSTDKPAVFREAFRVLRSGGRLAVSDMVRLGEFTPEQEADMRAWTGCMAGAETVEFYVAELQAAGFEQISIRERDAAEVELAAVTESEVAKARVFSARITALKPFGS